MYQKQNIIFKPLITEFDLKVRIGVLVKEIASDYNGDELVIIGLLKGSFMFMADLSRLLYLHDIPLLIDFIIASSYGSDTVSSGKVTITRDITTDIKGKWVLLIDDILDSGRTMYYVTKHLKKKKPAVLKTCVFLDKPDRRVVDIQADYVGFKVPDEFIVGYGLDYDSRYRELPYLSTITFKESNTDKKDNHKNFTK